MFLLLSFVVACLAWTVTKEEVFREPREICVGKSKTCREWWKRKFFYLFTCEYCFSHYVAAGVVLVTGLNRWPSYGVVGTVMTILVIVWLANVVMALFALLKQTIKLVGNKAKIAEKIANGPFYPGE